MRLPKVIGHCSCTGQDSTRAQLAERLCVNPKNMTGMLQRAKQLRDKAGGVVEAARHSREK